MASRCLLECKVCVISQAVRLRLNSVTVNESVKSVLVRLSAVASWYLLECKLCAISPAVRLRFTVKSVTVNESVKYVLVRLSAVASWSLLECKVCIIQPVRRRVNGVRVSQSMYYSGCPASFGRC